MRPTYSEYFPKGDVSLSSCAVHGDGSPSLGDLLDSRSQGAFSRVLPIVPILPKGLALLGDDPYGCQTELNPRYKNAADAEGKASALEVDDDAFSVDDPDDEDKSNIDSDVEIKMPMPSRFLPEFPLEL